ncbi:hypothetical protein HMPREF1485_00660, partial [Propionibacterium sp. HGH0353]
MSAVDGYEPAGKGSRVRVGHPAIPL